MAQQRSHPTRALIHQLLITFQQLTLEEESRSTESFATCTWPLFLCANELFVDCQLEATVYLQRSLEALLFAAGSHQTNINKLIVTLSRVSRLLCDAQDRAFWQKKVIHIHGLIVDDMIHFQDPFNKLKTFYGLERDKFEDHAYRWIKERCQHKQSAQRKNKISANEWRKNLLDELNNLAVQVSAF